MNIKCYIDTINEELEDANTYICKAMACKKEHPEWARKYAMISEEELNHAVENVKIFEEDYNMQPEEDKKVLDSVHESIMTSFLENSSKVKMAQQTFTK